MRGGNPHYDRKAILHSLIWLFLLLAANFWTQGIAFAVLAIPLVFFIATGRNDLVLFVILIVTTFMLMNGNIVPKGLVFNVSAKMLLLSAALFLFSRVFGREASFTLTPLWSIVPYLLFMVYSSQEGWCPAISNLKLVLFSAIFLAYYGCSTAVIETRGNLRKLRSLVLSIAVLIVFGSVLLLPFPSISYMSNFDPISGKVSIPLFAGMCNHSQMLGPVVCVFGVLLYADMLFFIQKVDRLYLALLLCCPILLYMTSSRTAMASFVAGVGFATLMAMRGRGMKNAWRHKVVSFMMTVVVLGSVVVLTITPLRDRALRFVVKYDLNKKVDTSSESIWASRESKLNSALENWRRSPYIGNGFQVAEHMRYVQVRSIRDVLSAPVEKSTWTYAILEEGGVIGMILFVYFLLVVTILLYSRKAYIGLSLFFTFVLSNMGEFTIFSMSADGGLFWFVLFFGLVLDHKRMQEVSRPMPMGPYSAAPMMPMR